MNMFGQRGIQQIDEIGTILFYRNPSGFDGLIRKIKHIGVSNENPYGVMRYLLESEKHNLPKKLQLDSKSLISVNRLYEVGLSEICMRENVGFNGLFSFGICDRKIFRRFSI
jgi:hypothetical protein